MAGGHKPEFHVRGRSRTDCPDDIDNGPRAARENGDTARRPRGRPAERTMPDPVPASPEDLARAIMQGSPKRKWRYLAKADG